MIRVAEENARKVEEKIPLKEEIREEHFIADTTAVIIGLTGKILRAINPAWKISKNGEKAFALFLLTSGLIISVGGWPSLDFQPWLKMYWSVPLVFLLYFLVDVGQNIEKINSFFKRFQQNTEFEFSKIIGNRVHHDELERSLSTISFSRDQIEEIIEHLKKRGQFTPPAQDHLLSNKNVYGTEIFPFIKDSLISEDWESSAICIFLKESEDRLDEEYIKKLVEKCKGQKSIIFCVGRYYNYEPERSQEEKQYFDVGFNFKIKKMRFSKLFHDSFILIFLIAFTSTFFFFSIKLSPFWTSFVVFYNSIILFMLIAGIYLIYFASIFNWILDIIFKNEVRKELKKQGIEISPFELEKFYSDLPGV